ncbi:hypothetical protein AOLI_G00240950 [Acnodon oligacanthus]
MSMSRLAGNRLETPIEKAKGSSGKEKLPEASERNFVRNQDSVLQRQLPRLVMKGKTLSPVLPNKQNKLKVLATSSCLHLHWFHQPDLPRL